MKIIRFFAWSRPLCRAVDGVSAIEFAFVAPMLALLLIGLIDFGVGLWDQMQVSNAAAAGAEYAFIHGWNGTAISDAVSAATNLASIVASPQPEEACGCPNVTSGITETGIPPCSGTCPDGSPIGTYALVSAEASYSLILPFPGVSGPMTLSSSAVARLK